jgi:hypothetical protein
MSEFLPSGRLSAVEHGADKIQIQTEFSRHPEPRVATSVTVGGQVLHKIQKAWNGVVDSLEVQQQVETLIKRQHGEVTALVKEHAQALVKQATKESGPSPEQVIVQKATQLDQVREAFVFAPEAVVTSAGKPDADIQALGALVSGTTDLLVLLTQLGRLGDTEDCVLHLGEEALLLVPFGKGYLAALVGVQIKKKEVLAQLHSLVEAA